MTNTSDMLDPGVERLSLRTPTLPPATETNTYLVGDGVGFYVVEPATPYGPERRLLFERIRARAAAGETLLGAIVTHHHHDHVGAARALRTEFGVPLLAHPYTRERLQAIVPVDGTLDEGASLLDGAVRVLCTPGHAVGHLCLVDREQRWAIVGDMIASVGTILIDPDDGGDMRAYFEQLARLRGLGVGRLYPAHGAPLEAPEERLSFYLVHRAAREAKVRDAVPPGALGADLAAIVREAYADTSSLLLALASKSARAHLAKLEAEQVLRREGDRWLRV